MIHPEAQFEYVTIKRTFYSRLADHVRDLQSFALLGPRACGKRHILKKLATLLKAQKNQPFLYASFDSSGYLTTEQDVITNLHLHIHEQAGICVPEQPWLSFAHFIDWIKEPQNEGIKPFCLLLANLGRVSEPLAAAFLSQLRSLHDSNLKQMVMGICGEANAARLVHGNGSWYQCDYYYVIQGLDREVFGDSFDRMAVCLNIRFEDSEAFKNELYDRTGADLRLLRHVLHVFSIRCREKPLSIDDLPESFLEFEEPRVWGLEAFGPMQKLADTLTKDELLLLRSALLAENGCALPLEYSGANTAPHPLELIGLVRRDFEGRTIAFSSPYVACFAKHYFGPVRLGDLFARTGNWEEAFQCYKSLSRPERTMRPYSPTDYSVVQQLVQNLCGEMHRLVARVGNAEEAFQSIQKLADQGCRLLLGRESVSVWQFQHPGEWRQKSGPPNDSAAEAFLKRVQVREPTSMAEWVKTYRSQRAQFAVVEDQEKRLYAIVVADWARIHIPSGTLDLTEQLLNDFSVAWRHAANIRFTERRLLEQNNLVGAISAVTQALGQDVLDVRGALESVGQKLIEQRAFVRVAWLLQNPVESKLRFVSEQVSAGCIPVFPKDYDADFEPTGEELVPNCFAEASRMKDPFLLRNVVNRSLVPLFLRNGCSGLCFIVAIKHPISGVLGVLFLEQDPDIQSSRDLKSDLALLSKQVAGLILLAQQSDIQQQALNGIGDPIVYVDSKHRLRYANLPAVELFDLKEALGGRWLNESNGVPWENLPSETPMKNRLTEALTHDHESHTSIFSRIRTADQLLYGMPMCFPFGKPSISLLVISSGCGTALPSSKRSMCSTEWHRPLIPQKDWKSFLTPHATLPVRKRAWHVYIALRRMTPKASSVTEQWDLKIQ